MIKTESLDSHPEDLAREARVLNAAQLRFRKPDAKLWTTGNTISPPPRGAIRLVVKQSTRRPRFGLGKSERGAAQASLADETAPYRARDFT